MRKILLSILLLVACTFSDAQENGIVWKHRISRTIKTWPNNGRSELAAKIAEAVKRGKIGAYLREDDGSLRKMDTSEIPHAFTTPNDTIVVDDVAQNKTTYKIIHRDLVPDSLYHFITLEEWSFSLVSDSINGCIEYLGVAYEVHNANGIGNGTYKSLFWVKFEDVALLTAEDATGSLGQRLSESIWSALFPNWEKGVHLYATNRDKIHDYMTLLIDMQTVNDTTNKHFTNEYNDSLLSEMMVAAAREHKAPAWIDIKETLEARKMTDAKILEQTTNTDTLHDPANNSLKGIIRNELNYSDVNTYTIGMSRAFDGNTGTAIIHIKKVVPIQTIYDNRHLIRKPRDLFSMKYTDVLPMLNRIEERHPDNTLQLKIWDALFMR